jgi:WhiB family redox-sensing transcriptional regulator
VTLVIEEVMRTPRRSADDEAPWTRRGTCRNVDVRLFFPGINDGAQAALEYCRSCPVAGECLSYALDVRERHGIWGGTTPKQRRRMLAGSS